MSLFRRGWVVPAGVGFVVALGAVVVIITAVRSLNERNAAGVEPVSLSGPLAAASTNADVDPGSPADDIQAPGFELRDQQGRLTSLAQFRGKVVLLAFVDSHCTTICPLTTESMAEALRLLGAASDQVQLLGINANPLATGIADVAAYTHLHQMQGRWRFLTGSVAQLKRVWRNYNVYVAAIHNDIDHDPIMFLIDPRGREHTIYFTRMSYEGVAQQAQLLADSMARLLPGHPAVRREVSLQYVPPLQPLQTVQLHSLGSHPQTIAIGGTHPHLLLFFAGWLGQQLDLMTNLSVLDRYSVTAQHHTWPLPIAIDEISTESSATNAQNLVTHLATALRAPLVEDVHGRLADGYGVQDLPWFVLTSRSGRILWHHDGWLSPATLNQQVRAALAGN